MAFVPPIIDFGFRITGEEELRRRFAAASGGVREMVHQTLEYLAREVAARAQSRAPHRTGRLATRVGYRFKMGRSGIRPEDGDRVIIRADFGARGSEKAKSYAVEMGQLGRTKDVAAHMRSATGNRVRTSRYAIRYMKDGRIRSKTGTRTIGGTPVKAYKRRFANLAHPFLGPAGEEMRPEITQALTVALPRRLARLLAAEAA